ncbi:MAG TPA: hypothetical protein VI282_11245, partial [Verrucomicrobiae bacterium]
MRRLERLASGQSSGFVFGNVWISAARIVKDTTVSVEAMTAWLYAQKNTESEPQTESRLSSVQKSVKMRAMFSLRANWLVFLFF